MASQLVAVLESAGRLPPRQGAADLVAGSRTSGRAGDTGASEPAKGGLVLVVDDDDGLRALVCRMLTRSGYAVLSAGSGREALALADGHREGLAILLTDVLMPEMNGPELAARLRQMCPRVGTVLMSGSPVEDLEILLKPFSLRDLLAAVERARPSS